MREIPSGLVAGKINLPEIDHTVGGRQPVGIVRNHTVRIAVCATTGWEGSIEENIWSIRCSGVVFEVVGRVVSWEICHSEELARWESIDSHDGIVCEETSGGGDFAHLSICMAEKLAGYQMIVDLSWLASHNVEFGLLVGER